jgi:hypothetical protein
MRQMSNIRFTGQRFRGLEISSIRQSDIYSEVA